VTTAEVPGAGIHCLSMPQVRRPRDYGLIRNTRERNHERKRFNENWDSLPVVRQQAIGNKRQSCDA